MSLPEDKPEVVARCLIYLYTGVYHADDIKNNIAGEFSQFKHIQDPYTKASREWLKDCELAVEVYNLADRLGLPRLQDKLRRVFLEALCLVRERKPRNSDDPMRPWDAQSLDRLVKLVYSTSRTSDRTFRDVLVLLAMIHLQQHKASHMNILEQTLEDVPEFTLEIATSKLYRTNCPECGGRMGCLQRRCKCGQLWACDNDECNVLRTQRSVCFSCAKSGVVKFPLKN